MYADHPCFESPADKNVSIWRYMDFTKFVWLLDKRALFFSRVDFLGDKFEGSYPKFNVGLRPEIYKDIPKNQLDQMSAIYKKLIKHTVVNCWQMNEHESAAMWRIYLKTDEGIAIKSTFSRLKECFQNYSDHTIYIGKIKYIDYSTEWLPENNLFNAFVYKRKSFAHEQEIRALIQKFPRKDDHLDFDGKPAWEFGLDVPVDLDMLIAEIRISPTAPVWFAELVKAVARKYSVAKEVIQSSLSEDPVF